MGDVREILGMQKKRKAAQSAAAAASGLLSGSSTIHASSSSTSRRPEGMSKEVFALMGSAGTSAELPPVAPATSQSITNSSRIRDLAKKRAKPWKWIEFSNSARQDGFKLKHWQREDRITPDYPFSRFNRKTAVVTYSVDEYANFVEALEDSGNWSKEETDLLFRLAEKLDLRFIVMEDKWPQEPKRSVVELKARYYAVAKAVILGRRSKQIVKIPPGGGKEKGKGKAEVAPAAPSQQQSEEQTSQPMEEEPKPGWERTVSTKALREVENAIAQYTYDDAYDAKRTQQLQVMFAKSQAEEKEITRLAAEIRRIDMQLKRLHREQPKLSKSSNKKPSSSSSLARGSKNGPSGGIGLQLPPTLVDSILNDADVLSKNTAKRERGVYLRSASLYVDYSSLGIGTKMQKRMGDLLKELSVPVRPVPTEAVCNAFDKLRQDALKLLALQSKIKQERSKLAKARGVPLSSDKSNKGSRKKKSLMRSLSSTSGLSTATSPLLQKTLVTSVEPSSQDIKTEPSDEAVRKRTPSQAELDGEQIQKQQKT